MNWARSRRTLCAAVAVLVALGGLAAGPGASAQQATGWRAEAERVGVQTTIDAELVTRPGEDTPRQIRGKMTIVWTNPGRDPVEFLYFHLYANAFRDGESAFLRERNRDGGELPEPMVWGGCEITQLTLPVGDPRGRQPTMEFVPFEDAPQDRTVVRVKLPQPVESAGRVILRAEFTTELPRPVARMGAVKDFVMAAQWFPKLGRFVGKDADVPYKSRLRDGWYCHHYHAATEFAADFADYDVTLTVPAAWTVGATGVPVGAEVRNDAAGTRTQKYHAGSVVDFAWSAGARFLVPRVRTLVLEPDALPESDPRRNDNVSNEVRSVRRLLGAGPEDAPLPAVEVVLLLQPEHADQEERHFEAARVALALYGTWLGPYPYPRLTIVDPPHGAPVGGMEYPTLVTAGTSIGAPTAARRPEHIVVHEIGHQWFMNLLASNEAEESWLDEGMNSWFTARAMHIAWGPAAQDTEILGVHFDSELPYTFPGVSAGWPALLGFPDWATPPSLEGFRLWRDAPMLLGSGGLRYRPARDDDPGQSEILPARRSWGRSAGWDEMIRPGWEYRSGASYRGNSYARGMLVLETLARLIRAKHAASGDGERRVVRAFREYARQFRFRHPTTKDLLGVLRRETDVAELQPTFDALTKSSGRLDYAIDSVRPDDEAPPPGGTGPAKPRTEITLVRRGEIVVPVTVRIEFHDGLAARNEVWDGVDAWKRLRVDGRAKSVTLDPAGLHLQDARLSDGTWTDRRSAQPAAKWGVHMMLWLEHALSAYGRFF